MRNYHVFTILILFLMDSCTSKKPVDFIIVNAKVYLIDEKFSSGESLQLQMGGLLQLVNLMKLFYGMHPII